MRTASVEVTLDRHGDNDSCAVEHEAGAFHTGRMSQRAATSKHGRTPIRDVALVFCRPSGS